MFCFINININQLLPTWEQLADRFKSQSNDIIFAKFDGSDVDVPDSSPWIELEGIVYNSIKKCRKIK